MSGGSLGPCAFRWPRIAATAASSSARERAMRRLPGVGIHRGARSGIRASETTSPRAVRVAAARRSATGPSSWPKSESPTTSRARVITSASMSTIPPALTSRRSRRRAAAVRGVPRDRGQGVGMEGGLEHAPVLAPDGVVAGQQSLPGHPGQGAVLDGVLGHVAGPAHQHRADVLGIADQVGRGRGDRELHDVAMAAPLLGEEREGVDADAPHGAQHVPAGGSRGSSRGPTMSAWAFRQVSVPSGRSPRARSAPTRGVRSGR